MNRKNKLLFVSLLLLGIFLSLYFSGCSDQGDANHFRKVLFEGDYGKQGTANSNTNNSNVLPSKLSGTYTNHDTAGLRMAIANSPYSVAGSVQIYANLTVDPGVQIIIPSCEFDVFANSNITLNGTKANPIRISGNSSAASGSGIFFLGNNGSSPQISMNYVTFDSCGQNIAISGNVTNCQFNSTNAQCICVGDGNVSNCNFSKGIYILGGDNNLQISYCNINGITIDNGSGQENVKINYCNLSQAGPKEPPDAYPYCLYNRTSKKIDATNNWWGVATSTAAVSSLIADYGANSVNFTPYQHGPVSMAGPQ